MHFTQNQLTYGILNAMEEFFYSSVFTNNFLSPCYCSATESCQIESSRGISPIYSQNRSKIVIEANTCPHTYLSQEDTVFVQIQ